MLFEIGLVWLELEIIHFCLQSRILRFWGRKTMGIEFVNLVMVQLPYS